MFDAAKPVYEKTLAEIREAGLYKSERVIVTPQSAEIGVAQDGSKATGKLAEDRAAMLGLVLTVLASFLNLGTTWGVLIALTIAIAKAILVILYFMHVRESSRTTWLFVAAGFIWLAVLIGLMIVAAVWFGEVRLIDNLLVGPR